MLVLGPSDCPHPVYDYASAPHLQAYGLVPGGKAVKVIIPSGKGTAVAARLEVSIKKGEGDMAADKGGLFVETVEGQIGEWVSHVF